MNLLKVELNRKTYKMASPPTFPAFLTQLTHKLGKNPLDSFEIVYFDSEADQIQVQNEEDYQLALLSSAPNSLKFSLRTLSDFHPNNEEIFRLSNMCEYLAKIEEEMENSSTKKTEPINQKTDAGSPNNNNALSTKDPPDNLSRSFLKKDLNKQETSSLPSEASVLDFIHLFVLLKIKEVVVDPFRTLCSLTPAPFFKNDPNTTKSTNAVNSIDLSCNKILTDTFLQLPNDSSTISKSEIPPKRSDLLSKINVSCLNRP